MGLTSSRELNELLLIEEADAWFEYADATKNQAGSRFAARAARSGGRGGLTPEGPEKQVLT